MISGQNICCAHHGLSLLISVQLGTEKRTLLFDAGPEGATFLRNAGILAVDFAAVEAVVLSHGHWDHVYGVMGGLHLSGVTEKIIPDTIGALKQFDLKLLAPGHCTGWRALTAMARVFCDELVPSAVGKRYVIFNHEEVHDHNEKLPLDR